MRLFRNERRVNKPSGKAGFKRLPFHVRNVLKDFLEINAALTPEGYRFLIRHLCRQSLNAQEVHSPSTFSVGDILVTVIRDSKIRQCWLYYPDQKTLETYYLRS